MTRDAIERLRGFRDVSKRLLGSPHIPRLLADGPPLRTSPPPAVGVVTLDYPAPSEEAFLAAGEEVVRRSDTLCAIWNRKPAGGVGGTADVVHYVRKKGITVVHVNPIVATVRTLV